MTSADKPTPKLRDDVLRLLPWTTLDGQLCYLDSNDKNSMLSHLADIVEEEMVETGAEVLKDAETVLADANAPDKALRVALQQMIWTLGDVLRIAESRGTRLMIAENASDDGDGDSGPRLPADAFG